MTNRTNRIKLDEVLEELYYLREENQSLRLGNDFLQRQNAACKLRCGKLAIQVRELESEIADMKFTHKMLNSEEAGRAFAQELLGKPMTKADIEEEKMIADGEAHYERFAFLGDDF